jgi:hypothetical protein
MSNLVDPTKLDQSIIDSIVLRGDLSGLKEEQLTGYYNYRCQQVGLDPSAKPFDLLVLSGKKVLYANAGATQQLANLHGLSTQITQRERVENVYLVSVRCTGKDGRSSENQGAVDIEGMKGEKLANALMKATTKAIRRTVLAHCGLGMLDESELDTIPTNQYQKVDLPPVQPLPALQEVIEGKYKVLIPEGDKSKVYASHDTELQWQDNFFGLIGKISSSGKLTNEEKNAKLATLFRINAETYHSFSGVAAVAWKKRCHDHEVEGFETKKVVTLDAIEDDIEAVFE